MFNLKKRKMKKINFKGRTVTDLISKGTRESLEKLTDEELGEVQAKIIQGFVVITVQQAAVGIEQRKRGLVDDEKVMKDYIAWVCDQIAKDDDLFSFNAK